jgi:glycerophosphoryl diester phosphodiesterase
MDTLSLRGANFVEPLVSVRSLAVLAGMGGVDGVVSIRELMELLGDRQFGPMPVYVIGHNTNTIGEVIEALNSGANAVEIDVTAYESNLNQLCIDHAGLLGDSPGGDSAPAFEEFLHALRAVVDEASQRLALVVFDCKPPASTPEHGRTMIDAIRTVLTAGTTLNVIISVADVTSSNPFRLDGTSVFDRIAVNMRPREAFMIDAVDSPDDVESFFAGLGVTRSCYGNGTSFPLSDEGAMVFRTPIERACWMRVARGGPRFIYAWTVNDSDDQRSYLSVGVNGRISDPRGIGRLVDVLSEPSVGARCRLARRSDNPFLPANTFYGLTVSTSDLAMAGTDSHVTFTVTGALGTSSTTVDTNFNRRMERGLRNFVTLPSRDLGELQSVTVTRDNSGNAPDWHLTSIVVESLRYRMRKTGVFDCWIDTTEAFTRPLT